jgi:hypothetical protein
MLTVILTFLLIQNLNVCVITRSVLNDNGRNKQYLDIREGICYNVDPEVTLIRFPFLPVS